MSYTVTITLDDDILTSGETTTVTFTFSEPVTGVDDPMSVFADKASMSTPMSLDGGLTWTSILTPNPGTSDSYNVVTFDDMMVLAQSGQPGPGILTSDPYSIDTMAPAVNITMSDNALKAGETATVTFTFSEAVTGFTTADLAAPDGAFSVLSSSDGGVTWTATFTPSAGTHANGSIAVNLAGVTTVSTASAGTGLSAPATYVSDDAAPTVNSIVVSDTALKIGDTPNVTFTFSEVVGNFDLSDLTVANGTLSNLATSDGITWTATLTPNATTTDSTNRITLNNAGVTDVVGNPGSGTTDSNNYAVDTVRPTASIVVTDTALAAGETSLVTITFSEAVTGFTNADLTVSHGTLSAVSSSDGGVTWTATLTPSASTSDATNLITLNNTGVTDAAGNSGTGTTDSNNYAVDTVRPTASIVVTDTALAAGETSLVTITFSEAVTGFTNADLTVSHGTLSAVSSSDGGVTWTATLTPSASTSDASNVITVDMTGVTDAAGNSGVGTVDSNNYAVETTTALSATITLADTALKAGETSQVTFTFSEAVTGFDNADLTAPNGTLSAVSSSDGGVTWTADFTPTAGISDATNKIDLDMTGVTTLAMVAGVGTASSGNFTIDTARPTAAITMSDTALAAGETATVTITFSEAVTGFTTADLTTPNGALSGLSSSDGGVTWTATFTPTAAISDSSNQISLDLTGVTNGAGNAGTGSALSANYGVNTVTVAPPVTPPPSTTPSSGDDQITLPALGGHIEAGSGNDTVTGGAGPDFLQGNQGNDSLTGGGQDTLIGGQGDDHLVLITSGLGGGAALGGGMLFGGLGDDIVTGAGGSDFLQGNQGNDVLVGGGGADIILGGQGHDVIRGGTSDLIGDQMFGGLGNDTLIGGAGSDILLQGNQGDDVVNGGEGGDTIYGGQGDDTVNGDAGDDIIVGDLGNDLLRGGLGDDYLFSDNGNDTLEGGDGNDYLGISAGGSPGDDVLTGGAGADLFFFNKDGGDVVVTDFSRAQGDKIVVSRADAADFTALSARLSTVDGDTVITLGTKTLTLADIASSSLSAGDFLFSN